MNGYVRKKIIRPKMSVSNFKNMGFRNNFKGFSSFEFLNFETRWDCRSYRIYGNLDNRSTVGRNNFDAFVKSLKTPLGVIPVCLPLRRKGAGIQYFQVLLDACLRRHDEVLGFLRDHQLY
jgi:hypothetical protein